MSERALNVAVLLFCVALAVLGLRTAEPVEPPRRARALTPQSALPAGAALFVTLDVRAFRASRFASLLETGGRELTAVSRVEELCGFDPGRELRELALTVPATGSDFGIAAGGTLSEKLIVECARKVLAARGETALVRHQGAFAVVRAASGAQASLAARDGLVLVGGGSYFDAMIGTAQGAPSVARDPLHRALRDPLGSGMAFALSAVLAPSWLERWSESELARLSPLSAVRALALGIELTEQIGIKAIVGCSAVEPCKEVILLLREQLRDSVPEVGADLASRLHVSHREREVRASLSLTAAEAEMLLGVVRGVLR